MTIEKLEFLKSMIRIMKSKSDDVLLVFFGSVYSINTEKSCIKKYTPNNNTYNEIMSSLNHTIHLVDIVTSSSEETINDTEDNLVTNNPYVYCTNLNYLFETYANTIISFTKHIEVCSYTKGSNDLINDVYYGPILEELFSHGTGYGKIITAINNSRYRFVAYKGLFPYNKSDIVELWFIDADELSSFTNFKVIKKTGTLDVYTRNLYLP